MACEDLKAKYDALEAQIAQLETQVASEPKPEQGADQARLNALRGQAWAVGQQYASCVAASSPQSPGMSAPLSILGTDYNNPIFDTSSPTWAKDLVGGNNFLSLPPSSPYEWTQVLNPADDYENIFVGLSGWVIAPDISGADNPFLHPFGTDWEFYIAPDPPYQSLAAPTTGDLYVYAATLARDRGISVPNCIGVEIEQGLVPEPWRVLDFDRVCVFGRWIVDTGHPDFHTEIHPPALLVGARLIYPATTAADPGEAATFSTIIGRAYLVGQTFSDGHALEAHLIEEVAKLKDFQSTRLEAHPTILPKPFLGAHLMIYTLKPPTGRLNPLDRLMVSLELTVKTGVTVQVVNDVDAVKVYVGMNDVRYTAPLLPAKTEVSITRSTLKELDPDAASAYDEVIFATILTPGDPLAPVFELNGVETDTYAAPTPPFDRSPTVLDVTALPENTPVVLDDTQPFPIIGRITLTWNRYNPPPLGLIVYSPQTDGSYKASYGSADMGATSDALAFLPVTMNGDGKTQIVQLRNNSGRLGLIVYSPQVGGSYKAGFNSIDMGEGSGALTFLPVTMNGDGKTQIVQLWDNNGRLGLIVYSPQPDGSYKVSFGSADMGEASDALTFLPVTMNGDGKTQIVQLRNNSGRLGLIVYSPQVDGSYKAGFNSNDMGEGSGALAFLPVTMNGDGKTQIVQLWDNNGRLGLIVYSSQPDGSYKGTFGTADVGEASDALTFLPVTMNGDGKTQIVQLRNNNGRLSLIVYSPQADGSFKPAFNSADMGEGSGELGFLPVTMNGDGKTQIAQFWANGGRLGVIVYSPQNDGSYKVSFGSADMGEGSGALAFLPVTMNGDGKTQIVQPWAG
jgi:hypothetical protein